MSLAVAVQITGQQPREQDGGGSLNREFANRLQLELEASGASSIADPPLFAATVWPGPTQSGAKADGTLGADRLGMKCRRAVMWLTEALAHTKYTGHVDFVRKSNPGALNHISFT